MTHSDVEDGASGLKYSCHDGWIYPALTAGSKAGCITIPDEVEDNGVHRASSPASVPVNRVLLDSLGMAFYIFVSYILRMGIWLFSNLGQTARLPFAKLRVKASPITRLIFEIWDEWTWI